MLPPTRDYDALHRQFRWQVPARFNIGVDVCDRWAVIDPRRLAVLAVQTDGRAREITCGWLKEPSNRLANALRARESTQRSALISARMVLTARRS